MLANDLPSLGATASFLLSPSHAPCLPLSSPPYGLHYISSRLEALRELVSKLNPSTQEFVPLSCQAAAAVAKAGGGGALSANAPVFMSAAKFFSPTGMNLPMGGGGGSRDSSSDGSSNGGGHPLNRQVGEL
jgi:hypothetical protein